jgi:hypothetical protein
VSALPGKGMATVFKKAFGDDNQKALSACLWDVAVKNPAGGDGNG